MRTPSLRLIDTDSATSDLSFGVHDVLITASIVDRQVGPLLSDGDAEYLYLGAYFFLHVR